MEKNCKQLIFMLNVEHGSKMTPPGMKRII